MMTSRLPETPSNDQLEAWLDQLADGEMSGARRRELLKSLDHVPQGWRRCALAFLESQAWREALGEYSAEESVPLENKEAEHRTSNVEHRTSKENELFDVERSMFDVRRSPSARWSYWRPLVSVAAAAACFMAAFGLGLLVQRTWLAPRGASPLAGGGAPSSTTPRDNLAQRPADQGQWGTVQFVVDGPGGSPQQVQVPAIDGPEPEEFIRNQPPLLPPEIERELRRLGHRVETERQLLPVPLNDGRRVLIPVQRIEVRPIGGRGYQ
jgi:hypothetical protein